MTAVMKQLEKTGNEAVQKLRLKKLRNGFPFMINSKELPSGQCYLEYPNGNINLVTIKKAARDFTLIRELSPEERTVIRKKYSLALTL